MLRSALIAIGVFLLVIFVTADAQALTIKTIRGGLQPDRTRLVLELDQVADFRVSLADNPRRLVIDLPTATVREGAAFQLEKWGITELQAQTSGGQSQLNFMLRDPVKVVSAFILPQDGGRPDRLVIDYRRASSGEFTQATHQSLGTLSKSPSVSSSGILGVLERRRAPVQRPNMEQAETRVDTRDDAGNDEDRLPAGAVGAARKYVVVIDAGHGGKDPGAIGIGGMQEKNLTLAAAKELARALERSGRYKTVLTRGDDRFILLPERVRIARRAGADLFISLHADKAEGRDTDGLSIYTLSDTASDAQTEKLAAKENKVDLLAGVDLSHEEKDVAEILIDLAMRETMNQSRFFAGKVVSSMTGNDVDLLERPHRYAGFAVLKAPDIPSVLVEMGFISNPDEARRLQNASYRQRLLQGLVRGIDAYFAHLEKNTRQ